MEHQINEEIRDKEVRLISNDGEQLGIVAIQKAQEIAVEKGMDLVKIAPQAKPPVCKIMDYGKFRFEQAKREKEARKNQRVVEIKEIRLTPNIDIGDLNTKVRETPAVSSRTETRSRFRSVSAAVRSHIRRLVRTCSIALRSCARNAARYEKQPKLEGRQMLMFLAPAKDK